MVKQEIKTKEYSTPQEIFDEYESIFQKDITSFQPCFRFFFVNLTKANGCSFICKDSKKGKQ